MSELALIMSENYIHVSDVTFINKRSRAAMQKDETIYQQLKKICASTLFSESPLSCDLLYYLVKASLNNEKIKEVNIAFDVFKKDSTFDPAGDATVRVNIHNLRNRLNNYYLSEGKNDNLRINIPKGHYYVTFSTNEEPLQNRRLQYIILIISLLVLVVLVYVGSRMFSQPSADFKIAAQNAMWNSFFNKNQPVLIVLGNYYFVSLDIDTLASMYIRNIDINSDEDLEKYKDLYPQYSTYLRETTHSFLTKDVPFSLSYIMPSFYLNDKIPQLKLASDFVLDDLKQNNVIFIGSYKNIGILSPLLEHLNIDYQIRENLLNINFPDSSDIKSFKAESTDEFRRDYCLIAKIPVHNSNSVLLFLSIHDIGNMSSVKNFSDPSFVESFSKEYFPDRENIYFYCIAEVKGIERTDLGLEIIYYREIPPDINLLTDIL